MLVIILYVRGMGRLRQVMHLYTSNALLYYYFSILAVSVIVKIPQLEMILSTYAGCVSNQIDTYDHNYFPRFYIYIQI